MNCLLLTLSLNLFHFLLPAQIPPAAYVAFLYEGDSLYQAQEFRHAALAYSKAFQANGWNGFISHRYSAACAWALAGVPDSAFFQLETMAQKANYMSYAQVSDEAALVSLRSDPRWPSVLARIRQNKERAEAHFDEPLVSMLDTIYTDDQKYRVQLAAAEKQYGWDAPETNALWGMINARDATNVRKVTAILDKYGWLGADAVGTQGNATLFLVIQHARPATQEKYLPMLREAVKNGKARGSDLALLEDRVALQQGKLQIYGSQIGRDPNTQRYYVRPLTDPDNVDKRRAAVGLPPLADYVREWQIQWNVEQYKKDLRVLRKQFREE